MSESELKPSVSEGHPKPAHKIPVFGREFHMPRSRWLRVAIGVGLVVLGIFGFLPILGFWMIPLGLLVLSYEFHVVRRLRRRFVVWWERRKR
jgi:purine-cytosine permease-like protein